MIVCIYISISECQIVDHRFSLIIFKDSIQSRNQFSNLGGATDGGMEEGGRKEEKKNEREERKKGGREEEMEGRIISFFFLRNV